MHPASSVSSLKMSLTDLALAFSAGLQQSWGWRSGNRLLFLTHLPPPTVSDRQGADVNWLVLQALIKSTKSPFIFHFLLQGQLAGRNGKCKKGRRARKRPAARCASAPGASAARSSAPVRAPAESLLYCEGYVKHLGAFHSSFSHPPPSFLLFNHSTISPCLGLSCWSPISGVSLLFAPFKRLLILSPFAWSESWL